MSKLVRNLHIFLFLFFAYTRYESFNELEIRFNESKNVLDSRDGKIAREKSKKRKVEKYKNELVDAKKDYELAFEALTKVKKRLPDRIKNSDIVSNLSDISKSVRVKKGNISPGDEEDKGFYSQKQYIYEAEGTFLQFLTFLQRVDEIERVHNVKEVRLKKTEKINRGRYQKVVAKFVIEVYRYNDNENPYQ